MVGNRWRIITAYTFWPYTTEHPRIRLQEAGAGVSPYVELLDRDKQAPWPDRTRVPANSTEMKVAWPAKATRPRAIPTSQ